VQPAAEEPTDRQSTELPELRRVSSAERYRESREAGRTRVINPNADDGARGEAAAWGQSTSMEDHRRRSTAEKFRESREKAGLGYHGTMSQQQIAAQHAEEAKMHEFMNFKRMCASLGRSEQDIARCSTVEQLQILAQTGEAPFEQPTEYQFGGVSGHKQVVTPPPAVNEDGTEAEEELRYHGSPEEQELARAKHEAFQRKEFMTVKRLCQAQGRDQADINRCRTIEDLRALAATGEGPVKYNFGGASGQGLAGYKRDSREAPA